MNKVNIALMIMIFLNFSAGIIHAQKTLPDSVIFSILKNTQPALKNIANYRYGIAYRYSNESASLVVLDSLNGFIESGSGKYHFRLGNTEMVLNDKYSISLFEDDSIIYLTRALPDPVSLNSGLHFYKLIKSGSIVEGHLAATTKDSILTISLPNNGWYKSITFYISRENNFINRIIYLIKAEALTENGTFGKQEKSSYEEYVRVEAIFGNFQENVKTPKVFDEENYIKKEGTKYTGAGRYAGYRIITGSPEL